YEQPANSGDPWIQHLITNTYDGSDLYTGDIDQDGKTDFIISGLFYDKISWFSYEWVNNQVLWTEHSLDDAALMPGDISLNDMDGDGRLDVVVTSLSGNQIVWYKNKLTASSTTTTIPPTIIQLSSFTAIPQSQKNILSWTTESEIMNSGFNLYRAESEKGEYLKINKELISAKGASTEGASYSFTDEDVRNRRTYFYKLEDIDVHGLATMHGPVSATPRLLYGLFQ
ncbi:MAG: VCBS repeat-containing protein, partial [Pseudomonadota bacterium]